MSDVAEVKALNDIDMAKNANSAIRSLHRKHGGLCAYCDRETTLHGDTALKATRDHIWPLSRGGGGGIDNIVLACRDCNSRKGNSMDAALNGVKALPEVAERQEESDPWVVDLTKDPNWPIFREEVPSD